MGFALRVGEWGMIHRAVWRFTKIRATFLGVPIIKDYSFLGSTLGSPYFGKLPYREWKDNGNF